MNLGVIERLEKQFRFSFEQGGIQCRPNAVASRQIVEWKRADQMPPGVEVAPLSQMAHQGGGIQEKGAAPAAVFQFLGGAKMPRPSAVETHRESTLLHRPSLTRSKAVSLGGR